MSRIKNPREKKRLSLERDRRNVYGENDKASRKNIPLAKSRVNRADRRVDALALEREIGAHDDAIDERLDEAVRQRRRRVWRKSPDRPLGKVLAAKRAGSLPGAEHPY